MSKQGEVSILEKLTPEQYEMARYKPWREFECGADLSEVGAVMTLLPPPPTRVLDVGVGNGYSSHLMALRGYDVTGIDISPYYVHWCREGNDRYRLSVRFEVHDYETPFAHGEFDAVTFFDSLHHSSDPEATIKSAFVALKPGGVLIASEPGLGHSWSSFARSGPRPLT